MARTASHNSPVRVPNGKLVKRLNDYCSDSPSRQDSTDLNDSNELSQIFCLENNMLGSEGLPHGST